MTSTVPISSMDVRQRNRGVLTGIVGGFLGRSVSLLAPFIVMPAILHHLGDASFGVWMTAVAFTSMAMFVDFGIGNGLLTRLSSAFGAADHAKMRSYIASAYLALFIVATGLLVLLAAAVFAAQSGWLALLGFAASKESMSILAVCLTAFILGIPASVIQRVMYACQKTWLSNVWQIVAAGFSVLLSVIAVRAQLPAWQVIAAYSLPPVLTMALSAVWFFSRNPDIRPRLIDFSKEQAGDLLRIGGRFLSLSVITSIALNADNLIIAQRLGAEAVTEYAVPAKLASLLGLVVTTLFLPLWAANGEALARKDYAWVKRTTLKMSFFGGIAVFSAGVLLVAFSERIMGLWMGRSFANQIGTLGFLSVLSGLMAVTSPFNMVLNSQGILRPQLIAWVLFLSFSFPLKLFLLDTGNLYVIPMVSAIVYLSTVCLIIIGNVIKFFNASNLIKLYQI